MKSLSPFLLAALLAACVIVGSAFGADSLKGGFEHPPDSAKPWVWWHWMNGNITRTGITADLEAMKRIGLGGAEIFNVDCGIPPGPVKFNSREWYGMMKFAAEEAHRLGLHLQFHNCAGWSSSGGPWNTPEHAMQKVTTRTTEVEGPRHFIGTLVQPPTKLDFYRDIGVLAFRSPYPEAATIHDSESQNGTNGGPALSSSETTNAAPGSVVAHDAILDLSRHLASDGRLEWDVPAGHWTILRVGYTPTGSENHPAPPEGTGLECDKLGQSALDAHWNGFVQKVLDDLGPLAGQGKTVDGVVIDSYEVGGQNWTPEFRSEFRQLRGYDPLPYLPVLTGIEVDNREVSERFLWDLRRTVADLFARNYYGHFQTLCHEHGLMASIEPYTGPFESLQCGAAADIPMGEFWVGHSPNSSVKLASSVGHIYGQRIIGAESFTAAPGPKHGRWLSDAYSLKALGDLVFCQGINRFILHRFAMQPWTNRWPGMTMGQWGTHFDRTSTWWNQGKAWLQYVTRCEFLLQQGRFVADAAYFCGQSAPVEMRAGNPPLPAGYDYDGVNADVLLHQAKVQGSQLVLKSGMRYHVLILPPSDRDMTPPLLRKLSTFVADGLTIVGAPPQASPSLRNYPRCDAEVKRLARELWGDCDGRTVTQHAFGKGRVVWGQSLHLVFTALGVRPDFEYRSTSGASLAFIHRSDGPAEIYFVSNQSHRFDDADCTFRVSGKEPELWNAQNGRIEPAPIWQEHDGCTTVHLQFTPAGSVFVVFRHPIRGDHVVAVQREGPKIRKEQKPVQLRILKAEYGVFPSTVDVTAKLKALVAGGARHIVAGNALARKDPSPGVVKRLRVEFEVNGHRHILDAVEGDEVKFPAGGEIVRASYGNLPGIKPRWLDVTAVVRARLERGAQQIPAGNNLAGTDPAPNLVKQLRVEFRRNGRVQTVEADEGGSVRLPPHAKVLKALYGPSPHDPISHSGRTTTNLTAKLASLVQNGELNVEVDNELAGGDPAPDFLKELRVRYSLDGTIKQTTVQENSALTLPESHSLGTSPPFVVRMDARGHARVLTQTSGTFTLIWASGRKIQVSCAFVPAPLRISGAWKVQFPPGWKAPPEVTFAHLESWPKDSKPGVKYFSGTATYLKEFELPDEFIRTNREVWLDLGRVKNFAEVSVNGKFIGVLWKPPFRVNITGAARAGVNRLEVKITNLWPNRLIGDEHLPPDCEWVGKRLMAWPQWLLDGKPSPAGRVTFTTWHHWTKNDPLLESGLLGPVTVHVAEWLTSQ